MRLVLDTNAYTAFCKGDAAVADALRRPEEILMPLMVLAELRAGFSVGTRGAENEAVLGRFLATSRVKVIHPDEGTSFVYARLYAFLSKQGTPIPINDLWIASLVVQHEATLLSLDKHFDCLPQVARW